MFSIRSTTRAGATRLALGALVALAMLVPVAPADAQAPEPATDSTGRRLTDFATTLNLPGFDGSLGTLAAVDLTVSGLFDGRVVQITNESGGVADFDVATTARLCADDLLDGGSADYLACANAPGSTTVMFDTTIVSESFRSLAPGESAESAAPGTALDASTTTVLDPAALDRFVDAATLPFGVATVAGFSALGGGGNSLVQVETHADVTITADYFYIGLELTKTTNGVDQAVVAPGAPVEWAYDVSNTGNTAVVGIVVTDDREGDVCTIALLAAGASERCTLSGTAVEASYANEATAVGSAGVNPAVTARASDTSGYRTSVPATPTPEPTSPPPNPVGPEPTPENSGPAPVVDIELSTNGLDADEPTGPSLDVGDEIEWRYVVTNPGPVDLYDLVVTDDRVGGVCTSTGLAVGEQMQCVGAGRAEVLGQQRRTATVVGSSSDGQTTTDRDPSHHVVGDEVEGIVTTPTPTPPAGGLEIVPVVDRVPGDPLARTGGESRGLAALALVATCAGIVLLVGSEAIRRRHQSAIDT